jgi:hypothetical protein
VKKSVKKPAKKLAKKINIKEKESSVKAPVKETHDL